MTYVNTILLLLVAILGVVVAVLLIQRARQSRDTQGIRESEARLRLMVDGSPVMMWTARPDTTHDFLNATVTEFTGLPLAQLLDNGWMAAVHPEDRDTIYRIYMPAVEARRPFTLEYRLRRADGAYRWILDTGVPNHAVDGTFVGLAEGARVVAGTHAFTISYAGGDGNVVLTGLGPTNRLPVARMETSQRPRTWRSTSTCGRWRPIRMGTR